MSHKVTVTAKSGPGKQSTAVILNDVDGIKFDLNRNVVTIIQANVTTTKEYGLDGVSTVTFSIAGGNYSVTIS